MTTTTPYAHDPVDADWLARAYAEVPVARRAERGADPLHALAESLRGQLKLRDARIERLERELAALRAELDTARRLAEMQARLDRLEQRDAATPARTATVHAIG